MDLSISPGKMEEQDITMDKIKTILFDFGGVIITLDQQQAADRFRKIGLFDASERLDAYTQSGIFGELECGRISAEEFRRELSILVDRTLTLQECEYCWLGYCRELPQRNIKILKELKQLGYRIVIVSNTNPYMMRWALSNEFDGEGNSLETYVDALYMSYKIGAMKPSPDFFNYVIKAEGMNPSEGLFVDDGEQNVKMAETLGFKTFKPQNGEDWTGDIKKLLNI